MSKPSTKTFTVEVEYCAAGFYAPTLEFAEKLDNESVSCVARFTVSDCVLKLYKQMNLPSKKAYDDKDPLEVFDLSIALLVLKPLPGEKMDRPAVDKKVPKFQRLLTMTSIPGQGVRNIIIVFETAKLARGWVKAVREAQENVGLRNLAYGGATRQDPTEKHYCSDLESMCSEFGVKASDVIADKINTMDREVQQADQLHTWIHHELFQWTSKCEARNHQIKIKECDIATIKDKIQVARPHLSYKYIIPYSNPPASEKQPLEKFATISDESSEDVLRKRKESRVVNWKQFESSNNDEVRCKDLIKIAKIENKKIQAMVCT